MLLSVLPASFVSAAVRPAKNSMTFLLVVDVTTDILASVVPREHAFTVHTVAGPVAAIPTTVVPHIRAPAFHLVLNEPALEVAAILPAETASSVLATLLILAFVDGTISPYFFSFTMVLVVLPFTLVVCTISVMVFALPIRHIALPVAYVVVPIGMNDASVALLLTTDEISVVASAICPDLRTSAVTLIGGPLTSVLDHVSFDHHRAFAGAPQSRLFKQVLGQLIAPLERPKFFQLCGHYRVVIVLREAARECVTLLLMWVRTLILW